MNSKFTILAVGVLLLALSACSITEPTGEVTAPTVGIEPQIQASAPTKSGKNTFWCRDDLEKTSQTLRIDENEYIRGVTNAVGYIDTKETTVFETFTGVYLHLNAVGNDKILTQYVARNQNADSERGMFLGSFENNTFVSTAEVSPETAKKIEEAIKTKKELPLRLSFYVREYEFGLPYNFTSACKIEAL